MYFPKCVLSYIMNNVKPKYLPLIIQDGKEASSVIVAAFFVFCKLFKNPNGAADMFSIRRCGIGHKVSLTASQER